VSDLPSASIPDSISPALSATDEPDVIFRLSPLVRLTLLALYVALTLPLPFLAHVTAAPISPAVLAVGLLIGGIALYAALTERVILTQDDIRVTYAKWVPPIFRKGWTLAWADITALKPRSTGQGGLVYYFVNRSGKAFLLPMRVAGFARLVKLVQEKTDLDTTDVRPLAQPWMYLILLLLTFMLLLMDGWTIWTALGQP
jgi:hypothetical protein